MRRRNEQGFSLLEVMVVLALILILTAILTPNIVQAVRRFRLESAARGATNVVLRARYTASQTNRRVTVIYQPPAGSNPAYLGVDYGGLAAPATDGNGILDPGEGRVAFPLNMIANIAGAPWNVAGPDYTVVQAPVGGGITFSPSGTVVILGAGAVWLTDTQIRGFLLQPRVAGGAVTDEYMITVTPAGRIRAWTRVNAASAWAPR